MRANPLPKWKQGRWGKYFWVAGAAIATLGLLAELAKDYLELLLPVGIAVAFLPTLYMLFFIVLWAIFYIATSPVRLWCAIQIWRYRNAENFRLAWPAQSAIDRLDNIGGWFLSRW